ncbi:hypothetical protein DXX93_03735 [Thalassotalea euphylliae]|uniref:Uncharacterized protein n=1 Tax=Thalassotalea euphylliae TaxID=1655234 RepID=A0A3E0TMX2_9GAMM|nr:hypothetical protein DXX93_03735 [Thalassotalea euphylliae]
MLLAACYLIFRYAQTALWLWQALFVLALLSAILFYLTRQWFYASGAEHLTVILPDHEICWRNKIYVLDSASRLSFLGFWLVLNDQTERALGSVNSGVKMPLSIKNLRKPKRYSELFIQRRQLNYQQTCYLSYLIKAAQKHR